MLILVPAVLYFVTAMALAVLRFTRPNARYPWLLAVGGSVLALIGIAVWPAQSPSAFTLPAWRPVTLFTNPILFQADGISWPYAISIAALTLTVLLTAAARPEFANSYSWAGSLALGGLGLLAVTANNPLTVMLVWGALDITELLIQLRAVRGSANSEQAVIAFSTRALGMGVLLWANMVAIYSGGGFDFESLPSSTKLFLISAAGLRLGVLPLHLPYSSETTLRRGFGTSLRMVSAASSLILLARVPSDYLLTPFTVLLTLLAIIAALYGSWMWLRAPDELNGRPYWIISVASLSMIAALVGNQTGSIAWGCALVLVGSTLFLSSVQHTRLNRLLLIGTFSISALPFSMTASAWASGAGFLTLLALIAQALMVAGYVRHVFRPGTKDSLQSQPNWARMIYPAGVGLLLGTQIFLGLVGWEGARQVGNWIYALAASALTISFVWATPRSRVLNPVLAQWLISATSGMGNLYSSLWGVYRALGRVLGTVNDTLEGDGGVMWTLVFLVLFISLMTQGVP